MCNCETDYADGDDGDSNGYGDDNYSNENEMAMLGLIVTVVTMIVTLVTIIVTVVAIIVTLCYDSDDGGDNSDVVL